MEGKLEERTKLGKVLMRLGGKTENGLRRLQREKDL